MKQKWLLYPMVVMGTLLIALLSMTPYANSSPMADVAEAGQPQVGNRPSTGSEAKGFAPTGTGDVMVRGRVVPVQGKLLVELKSMDGRVLDVTRTDADGWYSFAPLASGAYQLRVLDQDKQELVLAAGGQIAVRPHDPHDLQVEHTLSLAQSATGDVMRQRERESAEGASGGSSGYVNGKVTAAGTGEGLANVRVRAFYDYLDDPSFPEQTATTDESGMYSLTLSARAYRIQFLPSSSGEYVAEWYNNKANFDTADAIEIKQDVTTTEINAELDVGGQILGRVTAVDGGESLQGASVYAYDSITSTSYVASASTNNTGVYALTGLAAGTYYLEFRGPDDSSYVTEYYEDQPTLATAQPISVQLEENVVGINAALETGGTINGTVTATEGGAPLEYVGVYAYNSTSSSDSDYVASGRTDAGGVYRVTALPAGSYYLKFEPSSNSGYLDEYYNNKQTLTTADAVSVELRETIGGIDASLETGGTINGTVTAAMDGTPIAGVRVYIYTDTMSTDSIASGYSQANGTYEIIGLPPGNYYLKFESPYNSAYLDEYYNNKSTLAEADPVTVEINAVQTIDAALETGGTINGTITAVVGGTPIENVSVRVYTDTTTTLFSSIAFGYTQADGTYEIVGLPAGTYYLMFDAPYNSAYVDEYYNNKSTLTEADPVTVEINAVQTIDAALETGGTINGTITAVVDGAPIENISVRVYTGTTSTFSSVVPAYTEADGTYEIIGLPAGTYYLMFDAPYNSAYVDEYYNNKSTLAEADPVAVQLNSVQTIDVGLETGGTISGVITAEADGTPLENASIYLYNSTSDSNDYVENARTDESGAYQITGLPAGTYYLKFEAPYRQNYLDEYYNNKPTLAAADPVEVSFNTTVPVDAALATGGIVIGRVTAADTGLPLEDVLVSLYDRQCTEEAYDTPLDYASTDASGVYTMTALATGSYDLLFAPYSYSDGPARAYFDTRNDNVAVTVGNVSESDAVLERGGQIMGQVTAADSSDPLADVYVSIYTYDANNDDYEFHSSARTNTSGVYSSTALTTDNYRLRFNPSSWGASAAYVEEYYNDQAGLSSANEVSVTTGDMTSDINAVLARGAQITGRVTAEDSGDPLRYVNVEVYDADGNYMSNGQTDENGVYTTRGVPTGNYRLRFETPYWYDDSAGYVSEYYNNQTTVDSADPVAVTAGSTTTDIDADLSRGGSITGKVTAEDTGAPLYDVYVVAYDSNRNRVTYDDTDSNGEYELKGLPPGNHYVRFDGYDQIIDCLRVEYDGIYYNQKPDFASADPVSLSGTETVENINAVLSRSSGEPPSDTTAPTLNMPDDMTVQAPDSNGVAVEFTVTASDNSDPNPTVVCTPASGSTFPIGSTTVTCTATDASGNQSSDSFIISVIDASAPPDTIAPSMAMPDEMNVAATSPSGAIVNYQVTASDDTDPNPTVVCTPPSGSLFPMGTTTVTCTATDASGNQSSDSFTITVIEAAYQIHLPLVISP